VWTRTGQLSGIVVIGCHASGENRLKEIGVFREDGEQKMCHFVWKRVRKTGEKREKVTNDGIKSLTIVQVFVHIVVHVSFTRFVFRICIEHGCSLLCLLAVHIVQYSCTHRRLFDFREDHFRFCRSDDRSCCFVHKYRA